ncbi:MAG: cytochrome P450 [Parvularculaceae bacterium]
MAVSVSELPKLERADRGEDDHALLKRYRDAGPMAISPLGLPVALRYRHIDALMDGARTRQVEMEPMAIQGVASGPIYELFSNTMLFANGEVHRRRRAPVQRAFAFKLIEAMRGEVAALAEQMVAARLNAGPFDFLDMIAGELPARVIARVIGLPDTEADNFRRLVYSGVRGVAIHDPAVRPEIERDLASLTAYVDGVLAERRAAPRGDFVTGLMNEAGDLTEEEVRTQVLSLIVAGSDTTRLAICATLACLLQRPDQWRAFCADPHGLKASVASEGLRFEPSVASVPRIALVDFELDGVAIPAGAFVSISTMSAMRDEEAYRTPDAFDLRRDDHPRWHPIFGAGAHRCLGEALARIELEETLAAIATAAPDAALAGAPPSFRGLAAVRTIDRMETVLA